ncbi:MAG: AAA family ATPase [Acidimicrobiia bacterium]
MGKDGDVLVVVSGLPGVGKSKLADALGRELRAAVLSVDPIEAAIWRCGIPPSFETGVAAYEVVAVLAEHQLRLGLTVIADAVSSLEVARKMWRGAVGRTSAAMAVVEVICSDERTHRERLTGRERDIKGLPEPSWDEVLRRRDEWEPWQEERLVVDSLRDHDENVAKALDYARARFVPTPLKNV